MVLKISMYSAIEKKWTGHGSGLVDKMEIVHLGFKTRGFVHGNFQKHVFLELSNQDGKIHCFVFLPVAQTYLSTWYFENPCTQLRPSLENRVSNSFRRPRIRTGHTTPSVASSAEDIGF